MGKAEEVRKLAVQSADSAKEIEKLIQEIVLEIAKSQDMFKTVNREVHAGLDDRGSKRKLPEHL
ncbi:methyl-accepting chemotaxis protein [Bacillus sp. SL00103]